ncbi:hypothetical protein [Nonomuraea sp. NPDC003709]|uniref:hypothetical protein n=1 Tax=Nonomuraea sp. NPDC003709 TaxID=3154450 RepID=UPI0033BB4C82
MARYERFVEELLDFLLMRLDETGFAQLVAHEPRRMYAAYIESGGGRCETRGSGFTACATCSQIPSRVVVDSVTGVECLLWKAIDLAAYREAAAPYEKRHGRTHQLHTWGSYHDISVEAWPCLQVRSLALPFADDPDYRYGWRAQYAVFASGKLVHPDGERQWPWQLP